MKRLITAVISAAAITAMVIPFTTHPAMAQTATFDLDLSHCSDGYVAPHERVGTQDSDADADGISDIDDAFPAYPGPVDLDNDCVNDVRDDVFPGDPNEWFDTDGDGIGNNADLDDDGDSFEDRYDAFPLDWSESTDVNGNGIGDNIDPELRAEEPQEFTFRPDFDYTDAELMAMSDAELEALLTEMLGGDLSASPYSSSSSSYSSNSSYSSGSSYSSPSYVSTYRPPSNSDSGLSGRSAVRLFVLLPLLLLRLVFRSSK